MTTAETKTTRFKVGDHVVDLAGFEGTIVAVTHHRDAFWYDVRFPAGDAVRYDAELSFAP